MGEDGHSDGKFGLESAPTTVAVEVVVLGLNVPDVNLPVDVSLTLRTDATEASVNS